MLVPLTIGQVARESGLRASAIRFYEKAGLLPPPARRGGQRRYDDQVLKRLAILSFAKQCGFSLAEVRGLLSGFQNDAPLSQRLQGLAQPKIAELDAKALQIARMKERISRAAQCRCGTLGECGQQILNAPTN